MSYVYSTQEIYSWQYVFLWPQGDEASRTRRPLQSTFPPGTSTDRPETPSPYSPLRSGRRSRSRLTTGFGSCVATTSNWEGIRPYRRRQGGQQSKVFNTSPQTARLEPWTTYSLQGWSGAIQLRGRLGQWRINTAVYQGLFPLCNLLFSVHWISFSVFSVCHCISLWCCLAQYGATNTNSHSQRVPRKCHSTVLWLCVASQSDSSSQ